MRKNQWPILVFLLVTLTVGLQFLLSGCSAEAPALPEEPEVVFDEVDDLPAPDDPVVAEFEEMLSRMSLEDKAAAMFMVTPEALGDGSAVTDASQIRQGLEAHPVFGICWFAKNLEDPEQVRALLNDASRISQGTHGIALMNAVDEEGGTVSRIASNPAFGVSDTGDARAVADEEQARVRGAYIGHYLSDLGFDIDFAPVCDVAESSSDVMWQRGFPGNAEQVGRLAAAELEGLGEADIIGCLKHFPGIGGALGGDSHLGEIINNGTHDEIMSGGALAFGTAIDVNDVPMVMVGHLSCLQIDPEHPASLSHKIITGMLRGDLEYDGIVVTDSLQMGAITDKYTSGEAAILAIEAGADVVLMPMDFEESHRAVVDAVESGRLTEKRLDESLRHTLALRGQVRFKFSLSQ